MGWNLRRQRISQGLDPDTGLSPRVETEEIVVETKTHDTHDIDGVEKKKKVVKKKKTRKIREVTSDDEKDLL